MALEVGILGAGTMGRGIAQVAAAAGCQVTLWDQDSAVLSQAETELGRILERLVVKGRLDSADRDAILGRIIFADNIAGFGSCDFIIEAVVEDLEVKHQVFSELESLTSDACILATNTSSLSITSVASACRLPDRVIGVHFFNPAPLMALVEIIPAMATATSLTQKVRSIMIDWGKTPVIAKDTPGFIVNRVARPYYGEALRLLDEGVADAATIDWAMRELGGFRMGPFELMDLIGNDVNLKVTETVFAAFYFDPRFRPSITQKRMVEAGYLGRKSGRGYYDYAEGADNPAPDTDPVLAEEIQYRILAMLINEAADATFLGIATVEDIDLAMTKGVNYPKGLLAWADELGLETILSKLEALQREYGEDRYRPNPLLRRMVRDGRTFYSPSGN